MHWAHQIAGRFPDGQLYVDLRGYDPAAPMTSGQALDGFLGALGLTGAQLPFEVADKTARFRSLLAGRRMLVLLDNAYAVEQVRQLLPGSPGCFVVVTSRDRLAGLVTRHGAVRVEVDQLPIADAVALLRDLVGDRIARDPVSAVLFADRCARLPLALRIAAEYATAHPDLTIADLVTHLTAERSVLDVLEDEGDERADVRAVFSWSYRQLPAAAARLFRRLAAHPGGTIGEPAMAALAGTPVGEGGKLVATLASGHLIQPAGAGRWQMHDLLRAYAADRFAQDTVAERDSALIRLLDHYLSGAAAAVDVAYPAEQSIRPAIPLPTVPAVPLPDAAAALAWLDSERATLISCVDLAARTGHDEHTALLSALIWRYLDTGAHHAEALSVHEQALRLARQRADPLEEGQVLTRIGIVYWRWGRHEEALRSLRRAVQVNEAAGNRSGEGSAHNTLGLVHASIGDYARSVEHLTVALAAARATGTGIGEASTLDNLGRTHRLWGRLDEAVRCAQQALAVCRAAGFSAGEGKILANLATARLMQGRIGDAAEHATTALTICEANGDVIGAAMARETMARIDLRRDRPDLALAQFQQVITIQRDTGDRDGRADTLNGIAAVYARQQRFAEAADVYTRALLRARADGDRVVQCESRNGLGRAALDAGDHLAALDHFLAALALATMIDSWYERARAARGAAESYAALGRPGPAGASIAEALTWYERSGAPEADEIRAQAAEPT